MVMERSQVSGEKQLYEESLHVIAKLKDLFCDGTTDGCSVWSSRAQLHVLCRFSVKNRSVCFDSLFIKVVVQSSQSRERSMGLFAVLRLICGKGMQVAKQVS